MIQLAKWPQGSMIGLFTPPARKSVSLFGQDKRNRNLKGSLRFHKTMRQRVIKWIPLHCGVWFWGWTVELAFPCRKMFVWVFNCLCTAGHRTSQTSQLFLEGGSSSYAITNDTELRARKQVAKQEEKWSNTSGRKIRNAEFPLRYLIHSLSPYRYKWVC